jgi:hypothetical protein
MKISDLKAGQIVYEIAKHRAGITVYVVEILSIHGDTVTARFNGNAACNYSADYARNWKATAPEIATEQAKAKATAPDTPSAGQPE